MAPWWKRLARGSKRLETDAARFIEIYGDQAGEMARVAAITARKKREPLEARHYSMLYHRITELLVPPAPRTLASDKQTPPSIAADSRTI